MRIPPSLSNPVLSWKFGTLLKPFMCPTCHLARNVGPLLGVNEAVHGGRVLPNQPLVSISELKNGTSENPKKRKIRVSKISCTIHTDQGISFWIQILSY
jgi:hypothetical protein